MAGTEDEAFVYIPPPPRGVAAHVRLNAIEAVLSEPDEGNRAVVVMASGARYLAGEYAHDVLKRIQEAYAKARGRTEGERGE